MKTSKLDRIIRNFILNEGTSEHPSLKSRLFALEEMLDSISGKTVSEIRRLEVIREQVKSIKRDVKRLEENNFLLEEENKTLKEKLMILEENKEE